MRTITHLVVHCTATAPTASVESIQRYWRTKLGWKSPGYHIIIDHRGVAHRLAPDTAVCNGVSGHNATSLHVSYIGGAAKDNRTFGQKSTLINVLQEWRKLYPNAKICGHRDFAGVKKACPQFDAIKEFDYI